MKEVQDYYSEAFPKEAECGVGGMSVVGDSRNLPFSPQIQHPQSVQSSPRDEGVSGRDEGVSGRVPDRFRTGRESLSVLQNVTRRESKRPKARSQDHDYKRRFSSSGPIPNLSDNRDPGFPLMGGTPIQRQSFQGETFSEGPVNQYANGGFWGRSKWIQRRQQTNARRKCTTQA